MKTNEDEIALDQEVLQAVKESVPETRSMFPATDVNEPYEFLSRVKDYCKKRLASNKIDNDGCCAFVFIPQNIQDGFESLQKGYTEHWQLATKYSISLNAKIFFIFDSRLKISGEFPIASNDADIHRILCQQISEIEQELGTPVSHVLVDLKTYEIFEFVAGTECIPQRFDLNEDTKAINKSELEDFARQLHEESTKTPNGYLKIWEASSKKKLVSGTEDMIVRHFAQHLKYKIDSADISYESSTPKGRADLIIHKNGMADSQGACVLEFKVVPPDSTSHRAGLQLCGGILQVIDYADDKDATIKYLMSYDARTKHEKLNCVEKLAIRYDVNYKSFRLYSETAKPRKEKLNKYKNAFKD